MRDMVQVVRQRPARWLGVAVLLASCGSDPKEQPIETGHTDTTATVDTPTEPTDSATVTSPTGTPTTPHNVLLIMADDVGIDRIGLYPNSASAAWPSPPTPNLDALAAEGVLFETAYAAPTCSPARAMMLAGQYPRGTGAGDPFTLNEAQPLPYEELLIPEFLADHGYTSVVLGKWHLGSTALDYAMNPLNHGFDHHLGTVFNFTEEALDGSNQTWYSWEKNVDGALEWNTTYATIDTTDDAIEMIRTLPEPWFVFLSYNAPHAPWVAPPDELYTLPTVTNGVSTELEIFDTMIEAMDTEMGRVFAELDGSGLSDRTTVVFTADNGTPQPVAMDQWLDGTGKFTLYEGGVRVPLVIRSPVIPAAAKGARTQAFGHLVDLFPTIADLAGVAAEADAELELDGRSLLPVLLDPLAPDTRDHLFIEEFTPNGPAPYQTYERAIRDGRWKLVVTDLRSTRRIEFYDLLAGGNPVGWEGEDLLLGDADGLPDDPVALAAYLALNATLEASYPVTKSPAGIMPQ